MTEMEFETQTVNGTTTLRLPDRPKLALAMSYATAHGIRDFTTAWSDIDSLEFVDQYRDLIDGLSFGDRGNAKMDLGPLYRHTGLKSLTFRRDRGPAPDLARLPALEVFSGNWHPSLHLAEAQCLRTLYLCSYKAKSLVDFPWPPHIETLDFTLGSLISIEGIEKAPRSLVRLELCLLRSLTRVEVNDGSSLRELRMDTCGKASLVKANRGIRMLGIDKCAPIPNLAFIADLPELELFGFGNVVDGNLQPILDHPRIRHVQMENRRHYSHTDAQIDVVMRQRGGYAVWRVEDFGDKPLM